MSSHKHFDDIFGDDKYSDTIDTKKEMLSQVDGMLSQIEGNADQWDGRIVGTHDAIETGESMLESQLRNAEKQANRPLQIRGKPFEQFIVSSVRYQSDSVTIERFNDTEYNRNVCDYLVQHKNGMTCWMEAKTTSTSMTFHQKKAISKNGNVVKSKFPQQPRLLIKSIRSKSAGTRRKNMIGALVQFKRNGVPFETWWCDIDDIYELQRIVFPKKSFNTDDLHDYYVQAETCNTYQVQLCRPKGARKDYLDIAGMMNGNTIDGSTVQLEDR